MDRVYPPSPPCLFSLLSKWVFSPLSSGCPEFYFLPSLRMGSIFLCLAQKVASGCLTRDHYPQCRKRKFESPTVCCDLSSGDFLFREFRACVSMYIYIYIYLYTYIYIYIYIYVYMHTTKTATSVPFGNKTKICFEHRWFEFNGLV